MTTERHGDESKASVTVTKAQVGWEVRAELDSRLIRLVHCSDWHRVERAVAMFSRTTFRDSARF